MKNITSRKCGNCAELFKTKKLLDAHLKQAQCSKKENEDEIVLLENDDQELKSSESEHQQNLLSNEHQQEKAEEENSTEMIEEDDEIDTDFS